MPQFKTISDYFASIDPTHKMALTTLCQVIVAAAPESTEVISYNMPAIKQNDQVLVYYAANKTKLGLYPTTRPIEEFKDQLKPYQTSKGAIQLPYDKPLPVELITAIVQSRVAAVTPQAQYQFNATIHAAEGDKGGAYVIFPYDVRQEFGKGRAKVAVTFDGISYNGSVVNMGLKNADGSICYIIGMLKSIRQQLGKSVGDKVSVTVKARTD